MMMFSFIKQVEERQIAFLLDQVKVIKGPGKVGVGAVVGVCCPGLGQLLSMVHRKEFWATRF